MKVLKRAPRAPDHLSVEMKEFWRAINADFQLEADALKMLQAAAENWDRAQQARELVAREGLVIDGKAHPATTIEKNAYQTYLRCMRALGLDVVAPGPVGRPAGSGWR